MPQGIIFLVGLWAVVVGIIWLVIGFRAMKAHERIASSLETLARRGETAAAGTPLQGPPKADVIDKLVKGSS